MFERQPPVAGDVVGVGVCLEHTDEAHVVLLRPLEVLLDRVGGIDDDRFPGFLVADQVGRTPQIVVDELAEQHLRSA